MSITSVQKSRSANLVNIETGLTVEEDWKPGETEYVVSILDYDELVAHIQECVDALLLMDRRR